MDGSRSAGKVTGAILAGGHATRFGGRNKAMLVVDGTPIIERQLAVLRAVTAETLVIGPQTAALAALGIDAIPDVTEGRGPLGGLLTALRHARHRRVLVLACDLPFVHATFLRFLVATTPHADAVVPRAQTGLQPLCAVYATAIEPLVASRLAAGTLAMIGLLEAVSTHEIPATQIVPFDPDGQLFANINTPGDYEALLTRPAPPTHSR